MKSKHILTLCKELCNYYKYFNLNNIISSNKYDILSIDQYIELYSIYYVYISISLTLNLNKYKLLKYNKNKITLYQPIIIWGLYHLNDYKVLFNHKGDIYIYWCGNDAILNSPLKTKLFQMLKANKKIKKNICSQLSVKKSLEKNNFKNIYLVTL
jgi:hypothetical protein